MAKSRTEIVFNDEHGRENVGKNDDEKASTSKSTALRVDHTFDNINDLKPLDLDTADAIRQVQQALLASKVPFAEEAKHSKVQGDSDLIKINELARSHFLPMAKYTRSKIASKTKVRAAGHGFKHKHHSVTTDQNIVGFSHSKKRPRALNPGSSKSIRKPEVRPRARISSIYLGKLSNVVAFKRRGWYSESDSDVDSVVAFY